MKAHPNLNLRPQPKRAERDHPILGHLELHNMDGGMLAWYTIMELQPSCQTRLGIWAENQAQVGEENFIEQAAKYVNWAMTNEASIREAVVEQLHANGPVPRTETWAALPDSVRACDLCVQCVTYYPLYRAATWTLESLDLLPGCRIEFDQKVEAEKRAAKLLASSGEHHFIQKIKANVPV